MARVEFIGVGEAFDFKLGNSSFLLMDETSLLIDCGGAVPRNFLEYESDCEFLDGIYLTHFHGDHTFGVPALLFRFHEDGRKKDLTIIGQAGTEDYIRRLFSMASSSKLETLRYSVNFIESTTKTTFKNLKLSFAKTEHSQTNYAVKVEGKNYAIGFSGDGALTKASEKLFFDCNYLVHEAYTYDQNLKGHTNALEIIQFSKTMSNLKKLFLVHLQRDFRQKELESYKALDALVPEPFYSLELL